ncbi:thiamine pyrophosphate-dependent enzyme [Mechercharimyces sp. CAU 1602]|nr:thiamine pyrophosphate-dependent enzyme [Mechercharimyces sp. CAU 1602]
MVIWDDQRGSLPVDGGESEDVNGLQVNGIEIAAWGIVEAGVHSAYGVYGFPATQLGEKLDTLFPRFTWNINEKVSLEMALGISIGGYRSAVIVKQAGMGVLYDTLVNAVVHSIGGGLVIIATDDIGCKASTVEQDSRQLAKIAGVPVLDPNSAQEVRKLIPWAYQLSEQASVPVLIRLSSRLLMDKYEGEVKVCDTVLPLFPYTGGRVARGLSKIGRMHHYEQYTLPVVKRIIEGSSMEVRSGRDVGVGIIATGGCSTLVTDESLPLLQLSSLWPVDEKHVLSFMKKYKRILVLEEPHPFVEVELYQLTQKYELNLTIVGRLSGAFSAGDRLDENRVNEVIEQIQKGEDPEIIRVSPSARGLKSPEQDQPLVRIYDAISAWTKASGAKVAVDVGSSIALCYPPYNSAEWSYGLGSPIGVVAGLASIDALAVAVIGDYAFLHSGMAPLMEAVVQEKEMMVIIIHDYISRRTGRQKNALSHQTEAGVPSLNLLSILSACGVDHCSQLMVSATTTGKEIKEQLALARRKRGVKVVVFTLAP